MPELVINFLIFGILSLVLLPFLPFISIGIGKYHGMLLEQASP